MKSRLSIASCALLLLLLSGCAIFRPRAPVAPDVTPLEPAQFHPPRMPVSPPEAHGDLFVSAQYCSSSAPNSGWNTFQVFVENRGRKRIVFTKAMVDDVNLQIPVLPRNVMKSTSIELDGIKYQLSGASHEARKVAVWSDFYPSGGLQPGETLVFQINQGDIRKPRGQLVLCAEGDIRIPVVIPRFVPLEKELTAITFSSDYKDMFVQFTSANGAGPARLWINNLPVESFKLLHAPEKGAPDLLAFKPPMKLQTGKTLHVKIEFADGDWRHALVRALNGFSLHAPQHLGRPDAAEIREYGLDVESRVKRIELDVTCDDTRNNDKGGSAAEAVMWRVDEFRENPEFLSAIAYCTAIFEEMFNIYSPIPDCIYAKPYRLGYGHKPARFIDEEEEIIAKTTLTSRPKPWLYIPESYAAPRLIEADELRLVCWMAAARGARGISFRHWCHPDSGFFDTPLLQEGIKTVVRELASVREILSPLVFASEQVVYAPCASTEDSKTKAATARVKIYTAWSGDRGLLVFIRNLDYVTDAKPNNKGMEPRFHANTKHDVRISIPLPEWLAPGVVRDLVSGDVLPAPETPGGAKTSLPRADPPAEDGRSVSFSSGRATPPAEPPSVVSASAERESGELLQINIESLDAFSVFFVENGRI